MRQLIPHLVASGMSVSTVKHAHHRFDIDQEGKDSWYHRQAGASQVLIASEMRWALMDERRGRPEPPLSELITRMDPVDLILVEGYKHDPHPKIEVWRAENRKPPIFQTDDSVVALVTDAAPPGTTIPVLGLEDYAGIATHALACAIELSAIGWRVRDRG
jgi:molybdopterin-guanine dinucleotide biosynthesis protein B